MDAREFADYFAAALVREWHRAADERKEAKRQADADAYNEELNRHDNRSEQNRKIEAQMAAEESEFLTKKREQEKARAANELFRQVCRGGGSGAL